MYLKVYNNNFVSCVESRLRYGIIRKKKMLICLLLFSRRKRSPAASIFLLFSIIPGYIIYIYRVSFLSKKIRRAIFVAGYVYLCVCFCMCVCVRASELSLFFSLRKWRLSLERCVAIKKSRHDVVASVPGSFKIWQTSLYPNSKRSANVPRNLP